MFTVSCHDNMKIIPYHYRIFVTQRAAAMAYNQGYTVRGVSPSSYASQTFEQTRKMGDNSSQQTFSCDFLRPEAHSYSDTVE